MIRIDEASARALVTEDTVQSRFTLRRGVHAFEYDVVRRTAFFDARPCWYVYMVVSAATFQSGTWTSPDTLRLSADRVYIGTIHSGDTDELSQFYPTPPRPGDGPFGPHVDLFASFFYRIVRQIPLEDIGVGVIEISSPLPLSLVVLEPTIKARLAELTNRPDDSAFARWIDRAATKRVATFIAWVGEKIVGVGMVDQGDAAEHYYRCRGGIFVDPEYRLRRIGSQLYRAMFVHFGARLYVSPGDDKGVREFYRKQGARYT